MRRDRITIIPGRIIDLHRRIITTGCSSRAIHPDIITMDITLETVGMMRITTDAGCHHGIIRRIIDTDPAELIIGPRIRAIATCRTSTTRRKIMTMKGRIDTETTGTITNDGEILDDTRLTGEIGEIE